MSTLNKVTLIGYLGQDVEIVNKNSIVFCKLSIATSTRYKDKNTNEQKETTEWHRVTVFNKLAEICGQYLSKGDKVYIEGSLKTSKWHDEKTNQEKQTTEIIGSNVLFLQTKKEQKTNNKVDANDTNNQRIELEDDDIPF